MTAPRAGLCRLLRALLALVIVALGVALLVRHARRTAAARSGSCSGRSSSPRAAGASTSVRRPLGGAQAPRPAPRARRALALLGRLRRDRLLDLLRARDHRAARRRLHAARAARRRACSSCRRALLRRGDLGAARDRRRGDLRPPRRQRPRRLHDRLGALPRLPDRDRALGALPARTTSPARSRSARSTATRGTSSSRVGVDRRRRRDPARAPALALRARDRRAGARRADPARPGRLRLRAPLLAARARPTAPRSATRRRCSSLAFAIPLAMLAFTGLETVANLAEEARRPGVDLPRSLFVAIGTVVTTYVAIAVVALSAFPGPEDRARHALAARAARRRRRRRSARTPRRRSATRSASSSARAAP